MKMLLLSAVFCGGIGVLAADAPLHVSPAPLGRKSMLAITFDDGLSSHHAIATPMLEKYGLKGTFYTVARNVGKPGCLTWEQLLDMQKRGMEIGNHSMTHSSVARILQKGLSPAERAAMTPEAVAAKKAENWEAVKTELIGPKAIFGSHGIHFESFAFSYSIRPSKAIELVRQNGMIPRLYEWGTSSKDTRETYLKWFETFEKPGNCGVLIIHGVTKDSGGWEPIESKELFEFLVSEIARRKTIYASTFADVMSFHERADATRLVPQADGSWRVGLDEKAASRPRPGAVVLEGNPKLEISVNGKIAQWLGGQVEVKTGDVIRLR